MTYRQALESGRDMLKEAGIEEAALDARLLMEHAAGIMHHVFFVKALEEMPNVSMLMFFDAIKLRTMRVPLQHITGHSEFMGIDFKTDARALIPRQDTEVLVEKALEISKEADEEGGKLTVLDLCTGSGCIAISLSRLGRFKEVTATDNSDAALALARENADALSENIEIIKSDMFEGLAERRFDIIVSNPPYIESGIIETLMPEVREHDPVEALDGGEDGLRFYRIIASLAGVHLNKGGRLLLEIGENQGSAVSALLREAGYRDVRVFRDYAGHNRVITAVFGE